MGLMRKTTGVFLVMLIMAISANYTFASAPNDNYRSSLTLIKGKDLIVKWEEETQAPQVLSWTQNQVADKAKGLFRPSRGRQSLKMPRAGWGALPQKLLIIPQDDTLKPLILDVPTDKEEIVIRFEPIPENDAWIWGITPDDPCPWGQPGPMSVNVRMINQFSLYASLNGLFVWNLTLRPEDKYEKAFYFTPDLPEAVSSVAAEGLAKANDISLAMCHAHHGGPCLFTLETNARAWGRLHQIIFYPNKNFDKMNACPI